ncbi:unnamed protein product [Brassicogethes aeneus]|uniref:acid phosphatase n=1 Tax=Brassicogethes aeneus TaxID=1431903 RepID=A0A9P0BEQ8_BRAAE|nr:unnamed protein product [Brassicogethes aeneus]
MLHIALASLLLVCGTNGYPSPPNGDTKTLVMLHVLFRHGNRTAETSELYPNDPYLNRTYFPIGLGQLTNAGKAKEFSIGKALRERYNAFLGPYVYPGLVDARSTDYNRTKASLLYCLAGLFPPRGEQIWGMLNWQAVPYNFWPRDNDEVLLGVNCPKYVLDYNKQTTSPKQQLEFSKDKGIMDYVSKYSGLNVTSYEDIYGLYFAVSTEDELGLKLPDWLLKVWPRNITDVAIKEYYVATATTELKQMAAGYLLQKMINDTKTKINEDPNTQFKKKVYLYSAHESNVAHFLITLDIFKPHIPTYGSYVTLEVHKINGVHGIKIYYQNYSTNKPQLMKLPACEYFCPLDQFTELYSEYFPTKGLCGKTAC